MAGLPRRAAGTPRGKLKAIASRWASGRGGGKPADDAATGAVAAQIAAIEARRAGQRPATEEIEIGPDEYDAVRLFFSLSSQWRVHAMTGTRLGLEYAAIGPTAAMMGIGMTPALFDDVTTMERAALAAFVAS